MRIETLGETTQTGDRIEDYCWIHLQLSTSKGRHIVTGYCNDGPKYLETSRDLLMKCGKKSKDVLPLRFPKDDLISLGTG